jgi:hypothetical protein
VLRLERGDPGVRAPVLPAEHRRQRPAVAPVPADAARALAGQTRDGDFITALAERRKRALDGGKHGCHDLLAVLLGPVRLRARERDLLLAGGDRPPLPVEYQRPARMGALVDR